ncbi:MAG TPA: zf-TFIIB domain-containing protein [Candidatus Paceibacterota bacterium]|nr:zf-TFIIB domain-containing protein [Candidatus Paceibacterota bacterium]HRT56893.1 zf-TFIIB domain-containing protein [Candidatus Paceibacterota bacterium]
MAVGALNCPMCGASVKSESTRCEHCGTRLALAACPACFGTMFLGARYCSHCGARMDRAEAGESPHSCPRCKQRLKVVSFGNVQLAECPRCEGIWADTLSLEQICADREQQSAVLGAAKVALPSESRPMEPVRYVPCPVCHKLMNRVNFARCSNVIVDVCKNHGTWFDRDELRRIIEFIRSGGLEAVRSRELAELEERRRQLRAQKIAGAWDTTAARDRDFPDLRLGVSSVAKLLRDFLR